jgi:hypothetical protein
VTGPQDFAVGAVSHTTYREVTAMARTCGSASAMKPSAKSEDVPFS